MTVTERPALAMNLLSPDLGRMISRPFGMDEAGQPINHGAGNLIVGAIEWMQTVVGQRASQEVPPGLPKAERDAQVAEARSAALDRLVEMLNEAIPDERYHVSREYLLNESNNYSYEFRLFVAEYCRVISGDPNFFFNEGAQSIPAALAHLARPLGLQGTYAVLPRLTAKIVKTDLRVKETSPTSAVIQWYGASQLEKVPPQHRPAYIRYACQTYQGAFAATPETIFGMDRARVREALCQLDGAECCEWKFTWQAVEQGAYSPHLWAAGLLSLLVLIYLLLGLPGRAWFGLVAVPLPVLFAWQWGRARYLRLERERLEKLLQEQRDLSEAQYDRSERARAELQVANIELKQRISELTALHEIGLALAATLDLDALLDRSLHTVVSDLSFDRALVLLADEDRQVLTGGRSVGGTPEIAEIVRQLEIPLSSESAILAQVFRADQPLVFQDIDQSEDEPTRNIASMLDVTCFLGIPLLTKGRRLGILGVDNGLTGRAIPQSDADLLFTVGNQIATAIENARLYQEIEAHSRTLEQRVEQRTVELALATAEADQARSAAEAANETKSAFLANVSHELRTPLTSVLGFTKIIQKRIDDVIFPRVTAADTKTQRAMRQVRENLQIIVSEGERLTAMINDVLDLAKIESGKLEWKSELVSVPVVVQRATAATSALFDAKELQLVVEVDDTVPLVNGDPDRLIQVVINLLSNAVKFTDRGSVVCRATSMGNEVVISVLDSGTGIASEDHTKVFEQFKQVGDTLTDKPKGTGLGLPISKQIVEHHGGRMWLESELGTGSTFSFTLPAAAPARATGARDSSGELAEQVHDVASPQSAPDGNKTILIADDDGGIRSLLRQELEAGGYHVREARDGAEALLAARAEPPDLMVLDVLMPGLNGLEVTSELKGNRQTADIPIILLSVVDDQDSANRAGVDRYFTKPFDAAALIHEVRLLLQCGERPVAHEHKPGE